ncbi:hypothetical protein MRX96_012354 [Rhipicephalus microplus]
MFIYMRSGIYRDPPRTPKCNLSNLSEPEICAHERWDAAVILTTRGLSCDTDPRAVSSARPQPDAVFARVYAEFLAVEWYRNTPTTTTGQTPAELFLVVVAPHSPDYATARPGETDGRTVVQTQLQTLGPKPLLRAPVPFRFVHLPGLLPHRRSNPETQLPRNNQMQVHIKALPRQRPLCEYLRLL